MVVCAAVAAGERTLNGRWRALARAAPLIGVVVYVVGLLALCLPASWLGPVAAPILGWPVFAQRVEAARISSGAAWVGTLSYGLAAQLADEKSIRAPVAQIDERERWLGLRMPAPDLGKAGVVVDLARRIDPRRLADCFATVEPLSAIKRVEPSTPAKTYVLYAVKGPKLDVLRDGCKL
jgi:hypothetical protein